MQIKAPEFKPLNCPFCSGELEFQMNESFASVELIFICITCKKKFIVTKYESKN